MRYLFIDVADIRKNDYVRFGLDSAVETVEDVVVEGDDIVVLTDYDTHKVTKGNLVIRCELER